MSNFRRLSITNIPAKDWKIIHPVYENRQIVSTWAEDAIGFIVEIEERESHQFLVTSIPFGVSGIPDTDFATESPSGQVAIPGVDEFSGREELLAYWTQNQLLVPINGSPHLQV